MLISFLIGAIVGAMLLHWRKKVEQRESRRIPREWPLKLRPLANSSERRIWMWLVKVMFDQQILIKLPVTRFTSPANLHEAAHWYKLLNGVYCTFTICGMDGNVIGCVDVASHKGLSISNQTLKHGLLSQCGLHYWIVDPDNLPHLTQIRTAFLGERAIKRPDAQDIGSQFRDVAGNLHAVVSRQRSHKTHSFSQTQPDTGNSSGYSESRLRSDWEQNSFLTPLDSRRSALGPH